MEGSGRCFHALPTTKSASFELRKHYSTFLYRYEQWGWQWRAKLAVRGSPENPWLGYQEGTHNVVDIPQCRAHHPSINAVVELLKQGITELRVELYNVDEGTGDLECSDGCDNTQYFPSRFRKI